MVFKYKLTQEVVNKATEDQREVMGTQNLIEEKKKELRYSVGGQEKEDCMEDLESLIRADERNKVIDECQNHIVEYTGRYSGENEVIVMELEAIKQNM